MMKKFCLLFLLLGAMLPAHASLEAWNNWLGAPLLNRQWRYDERFRLPGDVHTRSAYLRDTKLCGLIAYEIKFHLDEGRITAIDIIFSNKGDTADHVRRQIAYAKKKLRDDLNKMIGKPESTRLGPDRFKTKAEVWKTPEIIFALEADAGDYVILHIYPPATILTAENARDVRQKIDAIDLAGRVQRNDFGDVFLVVPQVDQGDKGYCVPATYGRILRYYGIDTISMHQLAALFQSDRDDGTDIFGAHKKIAPLFRSVGINVRKQGDIAFPAIQKAIDRGTPLIWVLYADPKYEDIRLINTRSRGGDPKAWRRNKITKSRADSLPKSECGHVCLIVGYNSLTEEIAVSNSWSSEADGRPTWVPFRVAKKYSAGESYLCTP